MQKQTKRLLGPTTLLACAFAHVGVAQADSVHEATVPRVALTMSPLHAVLGIAELSAEFRVSPQVGVAGIAGGGSLKLDGTRVSVYEAGASGRYYALGNFRTGLVVGGELIFVGASAATEVKSVAKGLSAGAFVGGKWTARFGLTLEAQVGAQALVVEGKSSTVSNGTNTVGPLLNLNIGYSF